MTTLANGMTIEELKELAQQEPWDGYSAIETIFAANESQAAEIVKSGVLEVIAQKDRRGGYWAIVAIVAAAPAQAAVIASKPELMVFMQGYHPTVKNVSEAVYNFAKACEGQEGGLEAAGIEKLEKGFLLTEFGIVVSDKAPTSQGHTMMVKGQYGQPLLLRGCFKGTLGELQKAISETHPLTASELGQRAINSIKAFFGYATKPTNRQHYDAVHAMMTGVVNNGWSAAKPA